MSLKAAAFLSTLLLAVPAVAVHAAPRPADAGAVQVNVTVGAELAAKTRRYGARDIAELNTELADTVRKAAAKGGFTRVDLVLEDARPNHPTFAMLGRNVGLSLQSVSLGGAKITGRAYGPNGAQPLKSAWYETDLRHEVGSGTWTDAERAFQFLAADLARGRVPTAYGPGTPGPELSPRDLHDPWTRDD